MSGGRPRRRSTAWLATYRQAADQSTDTARLMLARIRHMRPGENTT
jgi:hypothetical protein